MNAVPHDLARAQALHARILQAHTALRQAERDLALLLAQMADTRLFLTLGYASLRDYGQAVLHLSPRKTRGLAHLGRCLPELPRLDEALGSGALGWTKARELLAVVTPDNEQAWVQLARGTTSRELERLVAAHRPGEAPTGDRLERSLRTRFVAEMDAVDAEQVRTAISALRAAAGVSKGELSDGALLAQMAQRVLDDLDDPEAPTGERFRVVLEHCPRCGHTTADEAQVSLTHVGQAACDAEVLEMREGPRRGHVSRQVPPAVRRAVLQRDRHRCQVPGCTNRLWLDLHHLDRWCDGGGHDEDNLLTVCCTHHRVVHEGLLAIERCGEALEFRFLDGRVTHVGPHPRRLDHGGLVDSVGAGAW